MTKIIEFTWKNEVQDKTYGTGNRVFNMAKGKSLGSNKWRCTICNREVELPKD